MLESVIYGLDFISPARWNALATAPSPNGGMFTHVWSNPHPSLSISPGEIVELTNVECIIETKIIAYRLLVEFKHLTTVMKAAIVQRELGMASDLQWLGIDYTSNRPQHWPISLNTYPVTTQ